MPKWMQAQVEPGFPSPPKEKPLKALYYADLVWILLVAGIAFALSLVYSPAIDVLW